MLLKEIEALSMLPQTPERQRSIEQPAQRIESIRGDIYQRLTPWQRVLVARHPNRPTVLDYVDRLFTEFTEISGDRRFADDHAIVTGFARYKDEPVMIVGHHKGGGDTKQKILPQLRLRQAGGLPQGAAGDEAGGEVPAAGDRVHRHAGRISGHRIGGARHLPRRSPLNLREMAALDTPIVVVVHGEGGSGGALGMAVGDRILMHEFAIYSVIPPEGCAAILWRDSKRKVEAADALKLTAPDLLRFGVIDEIVPEPTGGAHTNHEAPRDARRGAARGAARVARGSERGSTRATASGARWGTSASCRLE